MTRPEPLQDAERNSLDASTPAHSRPRVSAGDWLELEDAEFLDIGKRGDDEADVEEPDKDNPLPTYDAMQLNKFLLQQIPADYYHLPPDNLSQHLPSRSLYDWFVGAMNVAPLCDRLLNFAERLATWRKKRGTKKETCRQQGN